MSVHINQISAITSKFYTHVLLETSTWDYILFVVRKKMNLYSFLAFRKKSQSV